MRGGPADPGWTGGTATERAFCVLARNPSPMTLEGTNTWVLAEPGSDEAVVIDPGPLDEAHLQAVLAHVAASGRRVTLTLLTHGHADHAESADRFAELTGAPVRAFGRGHDDVRPGELITVGGLDVLATATPGHTSDSFSFVLPAEASLLTGDTVLGRGTTVVAWPDGHLESYLESLHRIEALTGAGAVTTLLPGHGPVQPDAAATVGYYLRHRAERLEQVRRAVEEGAHTAYEVVKRVYADVPRDVWPAAELSVQAQLEYLRTPHS
ncbi:MAG TPA: MBL fold metallo-hydrolase [Intrasporangium sp.]|uniref:MBL fold metallo-hydrolase n=1 Tax=Intrasporangium sp. TaxID=1925024 RepID=UPI002D79650F|nr:MBL fold metallo-hydrolase [Intrasporangium sp.]HET7398017.1 MBL fold metallo-hydrolase [Intrasporangium sp.]